MHHPADRKLDKLNLPEIFPPHPCPVFSLPVHPDGTNVRIREAVWNTVRVVFSRIFVSNGRIPLVLKSRWEIGKHYREVPLPPLSLTFLFSFLGKSAVVVGVSPKWMFAFSLSPLSFRLSPDLFLFMSKCVCSPQATTEEPSAALSDPVVARN